MRRIFFILFFGLLTVTAVEAKKKKVVILHTNDTHSCVMPLKKELADTTLAGRGGFLRRVAMVKEQRKQHPGLLLFDSGDFSQGSSYYTMFKGDVEVGLMNEMGYDAVTIGNHEFDFGLDNMVRLFRKANFPVICSNYDFSGTELQHIVKPYVTLKRHGVKIGVFALCPAMKGLVSQKNYEPLKFMDPKVVARKMVNLLRKEKKCDFIICLSHLGWDDEDENGDQHVVGSTEGIDLVLGGHTHTYMPKLEYVKDLSGRLVPVDQNGKHAVFVGKLVLDFEKKF